MRDYTASEVAEMNISRFDYEAEQDELVDDFDRRADEATEGEW